MWPENGSFELFGLYKFKEDAEAKMKLLKKKDAYLHQYLEITSRKLRG